MIRLSSLSLVRMLLIGIVLTTTGAVGPGRPAASVTAAAHRVHCGLAAGWQQVLAVGSTVEHD